MKKPTPATPKAVERALREAPRGDYYEFGVYQGYTFSQAQHSAVKLGLIFEGMHFFGFDSFQGLPPLVGPDVGGGFKEGDYACSQGEAEKKILEAGVILARTHLIPGFYQESLGPGLIDKYRMQKVAVALIDCDLYVSTFYVLNFLTHLIQSDSILIFDDWNCFDADPNRGERLAFRNWLLLNPKWTAEEWFSYDWHGQVFRMRKA
jgi:hypothetical protein